MFWDEGSKVKVGVVLSTGTVLSFQRRISKNNLVEARSGVGNLDYYVPRERVNVF